MVAPIDRAVGPPSAIDPPSGCRFHPRCPLAIDECARVVPDFRVVRPGHYVACHLADDKDTSKICDADVLASEAEDQ